MNPEKFAQELELINNRDMSEQTARMFMTELNKQLRLYPQLKNNPLILKQIERFEYDLSQVEIDWAQEQLAALQKFKSERGMLAGEVDENSTAAGKKEVQNENDAPRAGSKSLETLDPEIDSFNVLTLAKTTLLSEGYEYTVAGVKKYQEAHNIGIDGVIGKETYLEMKAGVVITDLSKELEKEEKIISSDIQKQIEFIWKYGTKDGTNISAIFAQLIAYQGDKSIYNKNKVFLDKMLGEYKDYTQSDEGAKAAESAEAKLKSETQGNGKTVWENIKEGNLEELIKNPTLLMTAGLLFLFGVVGGDTKYTDSVFKRIGWIIGGLFMGPKLYHEIIGPALADGTKQVKSIWDKHTAESPQDVLNRNINDPESALSKAFDGDTTLQTASIKEFQTEEVLKNIKLVDIPGYIKAIDEDKDIPAFLRTIEVDGKILTLPQVRIILEGIYETSKGGDFIYIHEVLSAESDANINAVSMIAGGVGTVLLGYFSLPVLASAAALVGVLGATGNMDTVIHDFGPWVQSFFSDEKGKNTLAALESALSRIQDPQLKMQLGTASKEADLAKKLQLIQALKSQFPKEAQEIQQVIEAIIQIEVASLEFIVDESLQTMTPEQLQTTQNEATRLKETIQSYDTGNTVIGKLDTIIEKVNVQIPISIELQNNAQLEGAKNAVASLDGNVRVIDGEILILRNEIISLTTEQSTATAERVIEIDARLAAIPGEIAALETRKLEENRNLEQARIELGNLMVESYISLVDEHISVLTTQVSRAIEVQGVQQALERNFSTLKSIEDSIGEIETTIQYANSSEKAAIEAKIRAVRGQLSNLKEQYKNTVGIEGFATPESVQGINFGEKEEEIKSYLDGLQGENSMSEFFGVTRQSYEAAVEIYKTEILAQIGVLEAEFGSPESKNIENLKNIITRRGVLTTIYASLFGEAFDETAFQEIINSKRISLLSLPYDQILLRENVSVSGIINRYFSQLTPENKSVIETEFSTQNTLGDVINLLDAFSQAQAYRLADNTEVTIDETTRTESGELLTLLQGEITF